MEEKDSVVLTPSVYAHRSTLLDPVRLRHDLAQLAAGVSGSPGTYSIDTDTDFFQALKLASPTLWASAIEVSEADEAMPERRKKVARALQRYGMRALRRPTPFGAFAGVGVIDHSGSSMDSAALTMYESQAEFSFRDAGGWISLDTTDPNPWIISNHAVRFTEDELIVDEVVLTKGPDESRRGRLRRTRPVELAWTLFLYGATLAEVASQLEEEYPGAGQKIEKLIQAMIRAQILYCADSPTTISRLVAGTSDATSTNSSERAVMTSWHRAASIPPPGPNIERRVAEVVNRIARLRRGTPEESALAEFAARFLSRYGANLRVPVLSVCDPITGIGYVPRNASVDYQSSEIERRTLQDIITRGRSSSEFTTEISASELNALSDSERRPLSYDTDVVYRTDGVQKVDFGYLCGTPLPAQSLGRFHESLPSHFFVDPCPGSDARGFPITAINLVFLPHQRKHLNIIAMPLTATKHVCVDFPCGSPNELSFRELSLFHDGQELRLCHPEIDGALVIRNLSMYNAEAASDLIRTLLIVGREQVKDWTPFNWGDLGSSNASLPEVTYRNVVLSKAAWRVPASFFQGEERQESWNRRFEEWREAEGVSRFLEVGSGDTRIALDVTNVDELSMARELLDPVEPVVLRPGVPISRTSTEYVQRVHLVGAGKMKGPTRIDPAATGASFESAGALDDWLSVELTYGSGGFPEAQGLAKINSIARSLDVHDWHFLFYNSPDNHLRWRAKVSDEGARSELRRAIVSMERKSFFECRFTTYRPEYQRYGGFIHFPEVSRSFTISSAYALEHWEALRGRVTSTGLLHAVASLDAVLSGLFADEWRDRFVDSFRMVRMPPSRRSYSGRVIPPAPPVVDVPPAMLFTGGFNGVSLDTLSALVHMHSNRYFGTSMIDEMALVSTMRQHLMRSASRRAKGDGNEV